MKNLILGAIDNYQKWELVAPWVKSAREHHDGDIVLLCYRTTDEIVNQCLKYDVEIYKIEHDPFGNPINHNDRGRDTQSHQMRFFHFWQFLNTEYLKYDKVVVTDVRDVVFQRNPFPVVEQCLLSTGNQYDFIASSESLLYNEEAWGADNMMNGFGPLIWNEAQKWTIFNVGVIAGSAWDVRKLFLLIYNMTVGRYIPSDQSAYGIIVNHLMPERFLRLDHNIPWACQAGTTLDPTKPHYWPLLKTKQPLIKDGKAYTAGNELFAIFHQWDRTPAKQLIEQKYA